MVLFYLLFFFWHFTCYLLEKTSAACFVKVWNPHYLPQGNTSRAPAASFPRSLSHQLCIPAHRSWAAGPARCPSSTRSRRAPPLCLWYLWWLLSGSHRSCSYVFSGKWVHAWVGPTRWSKRRVSLPTSRPRTATVAMLLIYFFRGWLCTCTCGYARQQTA